MRVVVLASGSQGNCLLVEAGETRVLVDAGIAPGCARERMATALGREPTRIDALLVTHGHGDHIEHAYAFARTFEVPIYATDATFRTLRRIERRMQYAGTQRESPPTFRLFGCKADFRIGELAIAPLPLPHDAPQVALVFEHEGRRVGLATDLGHVPASLASHMARCGTILLESNHDPRMLQFGPYRAPLKERVGGPMGHLSNEQAAGFLRGLTDETRSVVLMHVSRTNNHPELALRAASAVLERRNVSLSLAKQFDPFEVPVHAPKAPALAQMGFAF